MLAAFWGSRKCRKSGLGMISFCCPTFDRRCAIGACMTCMHCTGYSTCSNGRCKLGHRPRTDAHCWKGASYTKCGTSWLLKFVELATGWRVQSSGSEGKECTVWQSLQHSLSPRTRLLTNSLRVRCVSLAEARTRIRFEVSLASRPARPVRACDPAGWDS